MATQIAFETLLVARALHHQPVSVGIAHAVTENEIQPPAHFVDEVVHVGFQAAVIVAGEDETRAVIEECPSRKVNGLHAGEMTAGVYVATGIVEPEQQYDDGHATKHAGFNGAYCAELIGHVVVFVVL